MYANTVRSCTERKILKVVMVISVIEGSESWPWGWGNKGSGRFAFWGLIKERRSCADLTVYVENPAKKCTSHSFLKLQGSGRLQLAQLAVRY